MKKYRLASLLFYITALTSLSATTNADECTRYERAESARQLTRAQLVQKRQEIMQHYDESAAAAICASSTALTYQGFRQELDRADRENQRVNGEDYDHGELYFFLQCGVDLVNLSPLAYQAFNLNRDEQGYLGEMTLAIIWMSIGYLDISDPETDRSFRDSVNRILAYARKQELEKEIEIHEDLLVQIDEFKSDYQRNLEECQLSAEP